MALFSTVVQNALPRSRIGQASAATSFFREIGETIGPAMLGAVMTSRFVTWLTRGK